MALLDLRNLADVLERSTDPDARRVAVELRQIALAPLTHRERLTARAALICGIAKRFYAHAPLWTAACAIEKGLSDYVIRCWQRRDEYLQQNPATGTIQGFYWEVLTLVREPLGTRQIYRILKNQGD